MSRQLPYSQVSHYERVELDGKIVRLPEPAIIPSPVLVARTISLAAPWPPGCDWTAWRR